MLTLKGQRVYPHHGAALPERRNEAMEADFGE